MSADVDAEEMRSLQAQLRAAAEKLQRLKDKQARVTRLRRSDWDEFTHDQREALGPALVAGTVVLED